MLPRETWGDYENAAPVERLDLGAERRALVRRRHGRWPTRPNPESSR